MNFNSQYSIFFGFGVAIIKIKSLVNKKFLFVIYIMTTNYNYIFKTIIIGDNGVGKSSILCAYLEETFSFHYNSTIGVDFEIKMIKNYRGSILPVPRQYLKI